MKVAVCVLLLALFSLGEGLQCYSCPSGTSGSCSSVQQCSANEDNCLDLTMTGTGVKVTRCIVRADCDFDKLKQQYTGNFKMSCCSSNLCNSAHATPARPLIGLLGGLAALCWALL
ncbi:CD59 glycoprotein-like [Myripristis murdjan]|uniref:CD59 glycoprotein-like n=1 Tax=Myripristis murdjan TaxID=586833 RepID=UPI0011763FA2|nr:CD59 glycoprotein-like [Myripristis murdjan]XP_029922825.1 CD59 glycoprotein-like [Myripristis murdjan]XP_029922834.1 CD59 glycoprotein-like [Myripristis murdjan]